MCLKSSTIYTGEGWNEQVDDELGNFDYLMGANIDFRNHAVTGGDQILGAPG
ncbi:alpha-amylase [Klebsiella pneumoniae subsp. rhinoscleromatis]|nr:alpha-amylase [Klebsiella pneumoniae subsp. rhinoscleromatis]